MAVGGAVGLVRTDGVVAGQVELAGEDANVAVTHQPLQRPQVGPSSQHLDGERVAEVMAVDVEARAP